MLWSGVQRVLSPIAEAAAGVGERGAHLKAEIVHRRFLDDIDLFADGLTFGLGRRAGDIDADRRDDLGMEMDRDLMQSDGLDRRPQRDLIPVGA